MIKVKKINFSATRPAHYYVEVIAEFSGLGSHVLEFHLIETAAGLQLIDKTGRDLGQCFCKGTEGERLEECRQTLTTMLETPEG